MLFLFPVAVLQKSNVVFVDMRGLLGDLVCTTGDVHYDLSKVYQSLCGYDFIIMERDMDSAAANILCDLREVTYDMLRLFHRRCGPCRGPSRTPLSPVLVPDSGQKQPYDVARSISTRRQPAVNVKISDGKNTCPLDCPFPPTTNGRRSLPSVTAHYTERVLAIRAGALPGSVAAGH